MFLKLKDLTGSPAFQVGWIWFQFFLFAESAFFQLLFCSSIFYAVSNFRSASHIACDFVMFVHLKAGIMFESKT